MDPAEVLAAYDEQVRRGARAGSPGYGLERDGPVVREVRDEWAAVTWSELDEQSADAAIAAQVERFARRGGRWEWKLYSYDRPADLPSRLRAAGLRPEPEESLLVAEVAALADTRVEVPDGAELVAVEDEAGARALVAMQDQVFGRSRSGIEQALIAALAERPPRAAAVMAVAEGVPVAGGRVEFAAASQFAGLWGGSTIPSWRGRGLFRALVARRAALAAERGYRWLHVDASAASRPILLRLGFIELAKTTPFVRAPDR